ncbi:MAG: hypothetical protein ACLR7D_02085 [Lachnospira eligens]
MKTIDFTVSEHNSEAIVFLFYCWIINVRTAGIKAERGCSNEQIRMDKENNYNSYRFNRGSYGITLALYAGFGGATLAVLWQGISKTFHVSIGMASMIVAVIIDCICIFL